MRPDYKKLALTYFPYLIFLWVFDKAGECYRLAAGADMVTKLMATISDLGTAISRNPLPSLHPRDLLIGLIGAAAIRFAVYWKGKNAKKYRHGVEYGSARWGTAEDIKPFIDPKFDQNILLTQTERVMVGRNKNPKYNINKNVLVIGGSGSGKTRFHIKPNLMQMNASYIVTDPKGTVVEECGKMLQMGGYEIKILNIINFKQTMRYNPFRYIYCENDILKLVNCIMENTKGEDSKGGEDFWAKAEALYYQALIAYIWYEAPEEEKNMTMLLDMLNASEVREEDETFKNAVDMLFDQLEAEKPDHFAVRQYRKYKLAAGKTANLIESRTSGGGYAGDGASLADELDFAMQNLSNGAKGGTPAQTTIHEIVHQWWGLGNMFDPMDMENIWSAEGLTCYTTYRIVKDLYGEAAAQAAFIDQWQEEVDSYYKDFYVRHPEYLSALPEQYQADIANSLWGIRRYSEMALKILKAEQLVGGEEAMDQILSNLFNRELNPEYPYLTYQEFLDACHLTEEDLNLE